VPLVLLEYRGQRGKVIAYSEDANQMGMVRGLSVSRARAFCPQAQFVPLNQERYAQARHTLLNMLWEFTNRVEIDETAYPHTAIAYLDLGNLKAEALTYLGELIRQMLQERMRVSAFIGIARGKFVAYIAAQNGTVTLVSQEDEAQFVAPHPVHLLPLNQAQIERLTLLGIRTLGDLVQLPRAMVLAQFGKSGGLLHQLASGLDGRPVKPRQMPAQEAVRQQFEALDSRDRLDARVYVLVEALSDKLAGRGSALHQLSVTVDLERGKPLSQEMHLFEPVTSARAIGESVLQLLDRMKLAKPVTSIQICASHLVPSLPRQLELFSHRPVRQQLIDLTRALAAQYPSVRFYDILPGVTSSLLPERRFVLRRVHLS
jgi:nucleotidyltransferase/DNA polymerase involved in DNA repair